MSVTSLSLFDFDPLDKQILQILKNTQNECDKFYYILKDLEINQKNQTAITIRQDINANIPTSLCYKMKYALRKIKSKTMNTEEEYKEIIDMITDLPQIARGYIRRFNDEIAVEGSGINKIFIKTEEELAKPQRRSTLDIPLYFYPNGFDEYQIFSERPMGKNLLPYNLSDAQKNSAIKNAKKIIENNKIEDAPKYATDDMISATVYDIVQRQEQLRRALNKDIYSSEEVEKMSEEFHYNEILISELY
jgi:hypothetical protein